MAFGGLGKWLEERKARKLRERSFRDFSPSLKVSSGSERHSLLDISNLFGNIKYQYCETIKDSWSRVRTTNDIVNLKSQLNHLYRLILNLESFLDEGRERSIKGSIGLEFQSEKTKILEKIPNLPLSINHIGNECGDLVEREKQLYSKLHEYLDYFLGLTKKMKGAFKEKGFSINIIDAVLEQANLFFDKKEEFLGLVDDIKDVKYNILRLSRTIDSEIMTFLDKKSVSLRDLYDKILQTMFFYLGRVSFQHNPFFVFKKSGKIPYDKRVSGEISSLSNGGWCEIKGKF